MENTHIVIMAGGKGSRLWPLSIPEKPKQFIDVLGVGKSLLQLTVERFLHICPIERIWVVTSEQYIGIVREQLPDILSEQILAEPVGRNTAPCIAYACRKIAKKFPNANIVVTPSDALILNIANFTSVIRTALNFTDDSDTIVTIGITPTRPETGYGYIYSEERFSEYHLMKVSAFKEKPSLELAKQYLADGKYFWNAGIFVWNVKNINRQLSLYAPQISSVMDELESSFYTAEESLKLAHLFPTCDNISIDYAVMEKSTNIYTICADLGWSDLGGWSSLAAFLPQCCNNNALVGKNVRINDSHNCIIHLADMKKVVIDSLNDYIVCAKNDSLLICPRAKEQRIKEYIPS